METYFFALFSFLEHSLHIMIIVIMILITWAITAKPFSVEVTNLVLHKAVNKVTFAQLQSIIEQGCSSYHSQRATQAGFTIVFKSFTYDLYEIISQKLHKHTNKSLC